MRIILFLCVLSCAAYLTHAAEPLTQAKALMKSGKYEAAYNLLEDHYSNSNELTIAFGKAAYKYGDAEKSSRKKTRLLNEAIKVLKPLDDQNVKSGELYLYLGNAYKKLNPKDERAINAYYKGHKFFTTNKVLAYRMAEWYEYNKHYKRAHTWWGYTAKLFGNKSKHGIKAQKKVVALAPLAAETPKLVSAHVKEEGLENAIILPDSNDEKAWSKFLIQTDKAMQTLSVQHKFHEVTIWGKTVINKYLSQFPTPKPDLFPILHNTCLANGFLYFKKDENFRDYAADADRSALLAYTHYKDQLSNAPFYGSILSNAIIQEAKNISRMARSREFAPIAKTSSRIRAMLSELYTLPDNAFFGHPHLAEFDGSKVKYKDFFTVITQYAVKYEIDRSALPAIKSKGKGNSEASKAFGQLAPHSKALGRLVTKFENKYAFVIEGHYRKSLGIRTEDDSFEVIEED